jgi:hypothetical protein
MQETLFKLHNSQEPPAELLEKILLTIGRKKHKQLMAQAIAFGALSAGMLVALVFTVQELLLQTAQTGFSQFVSFAFSDIGTTFTYWKEFLYSIIESMPLGSIAATLGVLLVLLASLKFLIQDIITMMIQSSFKQNVHIWTQKRY